MSPALAIPALTVAALLMYGTTFVLAHLTPNPDERADRVLSALAIAAVLALAVMLSLPALLGTGLARSLPLVVVLAVLPFAYARARQRQRDA